MKSIIVLIAVLLPIAGLSAQEVFVEYDCSVMPSAASPPWDIIGRGNYELSIISDELRIYNSDNLAWVLLERVEPVFESAVHVIVEAIVKVPSNNNYNASPQIALTSFDPERPYDNRAHLWYAIDLYSDRIEFTRIDNDNPQESTNFGSYSISDLSTNYHKISLRMLSADGIRDFTVLVDDVPVIFVTGEDTTRPINAVDIGFGLEVGIGDSYWDSIRYWAGSAIGTEATTWGKLKRIRR